MAKKPKPPKVKRKRVRPLTAKQRAFVEAYVETGNGSEAVRRAGYASKDPCKFADQLRGKSGVAAAIEDLRKGAAEKAKVSKGKVVRIIWAIAQNEEEESRDRLTACRDVSKMLGYNEPEKQTHELTGAAAKLLSMVQTMTGRAKAVRADDAESGA